MAGRARAIAWGSFAVAMALCSLGIVFLVLAWRVPSLPSEFGPKGFALPFAVALSSVGALIASRRPENPIGWILCSLGILGAVLGLAVEYARWALIVEAGGPPGGLIAAWLPEWLWIPLVGGLAVVATIFPDGRFSSRRWEISTLVTTSLALIPTVLIALIPTFSIYEGYENPFGVGGRTFAEFASAATGLIMPLIILGVIASFARYRGSRGDARQQQKWLLLSMGTLAAMITLYSVITFSSGSLDPRGYDWAEYLAVIGFVAVPISIGFGVLKYRLYDIDVVISKAVVYGGLAAFVTGIYVFVVVAAGSLTGYASNPILSALAAAIVALAFQPVRRWAQRLANRLVYGKRATPYEVLSELSTRFAETYSVEDALPRLARVTTEAVGAERVRIWLRSDGLLRPAAVWPSGETGDAAHSIAGEPDELDGDRAFLVRHQGELLGAISVRMPPSEPLAAPQAKLLRDVAAHAGLVLRNVALVSDLRASRQRIVSAQDERARKLERDLHDGAQQQLIALAVKLRLAEQLITTDPAKARDSVAAVREDATDALETLRDLARGIYPPLLADKGLAVALESQARKSPVAVTVEADGIGRYPQEIETATYFCALEALQNVAKYASAQHVSLRLNERDEVLNFAVEDDGLGFKPATARGSGLLNMRDRLEAVGGDLTIRSAPGRGTTVQGSIAIRESVT